MDYEGQFVLTKKSIETGNHWHSLHFGEWTFSYHPMLRMQKIISSRNKIVSGYILGFFYPKQEESPEIGTLYKEDEVTFEEYLYSQPGQFIGIYLGAEEPHIYLDPSGSLPVVYSEKFESVASSPGLFMGDNYEKDFKKGLYDTLGMPRIDFWFPGTITPHHSVSRLLPNHYLDTNEWKTHRHWPKDDTFAEKKSNELLVREINEQVKHTLKKAAKQDRLYLALTAGRDSRSLLSAAKTEDLLDNVTCYTYSSRIKDSDVLMAQKISENHHLRWEPLRIVKANGKQSSDWLKKVGHAVSGPIWKNHMALARLKNKGIFVQGSAEELARAFYWKESDTEDLKITPELLLQRVKLPMAEEFLLSCSRWLKEIENYDVFTQLDLLYIELRMGCWSGPQINGNHMFGPELYPFPSREIYTAMMQLDRDYRLQEKLPEDMIKMNWPELMDYPFNEYDRAHVMIKYIKIALLIPGYLRKRMKFLLYSN